LRRSNLPLADRGLPFGYALRPAQGRAQDRLRLRLAMTHPGLFRSCSMARSRHSLGKKQAFLSLRGTALASRRRPITAVAGLSTCADQQERVTPVLSLSKESNLLRTLRGIAGGGLLRSLQHVRYRAVASLAAVQTGGHSASARNDTVVCIVTATSGAGRVCRAL
jgi:hypothetical protein